MENYHKIERVNKIYNSIISELDTVLIGQQNAKQAITAAMLCDTNSRILLTGDTGHGKTTLTKFLASSFNAERISVTSDMLPSEIQDQLIGKRDMNFLQVDEFNRTSGRTQSVFIELFAENQMSINGVQHSFNDFYVFATQNDVDVSGIFNIPQAVYDRFDINVSFGNLSDAEKRQLLFGNFVPATTSNITKDDLIFAKRAVDSFKTDKKDEDVMMESFNLIDAMEVRGKRVFSGNNIRAHKFALKLVKLNALANGRDYLLPSDIAEYVKCLYMHRINQNIVRIGDDSVETKFDEVKREILTLQRKRW